MEETYREESIWGKECKAAVDLQEQEQLPEQVQVQDQENEKRVKAITGEQQDASEQNTIVESRMMNPLASLVNIKLPRVAHVGPYSPFFFFVPHLIV